MRNRANTMKTMALVALVLLLPATAQGGGAAGTLNVEVKENSEIKLSMAMPLELIDAFASSVISGHHGQGLNMVWDEIEREGFDLRKFWREIQDGNIDDFFTMETDEARVKAWRENGMFRLSVRDFEGRRRGAGEEERIEVTIPEALMDLLVDEENLQLSSLVDLLRSQGPMTLVEVDSDQGESVRIWLD